MIATGDDLMARARALTGLEDFGPEPFAESLDRLLAAMGGEARLTPAGIQGIEGRLVKSLADRLRIQAEVTADPSILDIPVDPIIIMGLNRTGTTKLHRVMATEPAFRAMPLWEAFNPLPLPGEARGENHLRIAEATAVVDAFRDALPQAHAAHPIFATEPEEETYCTQMELHWSFWFGYAHVPSYMDWVIHHSALPAYRWLRTTLQVMQRVNGGEGRRWLLKAPFHLGYLDDIFAAFPGARIVYCHRAPLIDPIASITKLVSLGRSASSDAVDCAAMGPELLGYLSTTTKQTLAQRDAYADRIFDVDYRDTYRRSIDLVENIHRWAGLPFGEAQRQGIRDWEAANPQHLHGHFTYTAAECGLDEASVDAAFGPYADWLDDFMRDPAPSKMET